MCPSVSLRVSRARALSLSPDYRVGSTADRTSVDDRGTNVGGWSDIISFRAFPPAHREPIWAVYGDMGATTDQFRNVAPSIPVLVKDQEDDMFDGVIHAGDYAYVAPDAPVARVVPVDLRSQPPWQGDRSLSSFFFSFFFFFFWSRFGPSLSFRGWGVWGTGVQPKRQEPFWVGG